MTKEEAFAELKNTMSKETEDIVYRCKDCEKYNLCKYYHGRKETSQICHYFALPERKIGKWLDVADEYDKRAGRHDYVCSECKTFARSFVRGYEDWWCGTAPKYCPNCGLKMEVDE